MAAHNTLEHYGVVLTDLGLAILSVALKAGS